MTSREHIPAENLSIWREAAAENRELRLLQITQMAQAAAGAWQEGEDTAIEALRQAALLLTSAAPAGIERTMAVDEQIAFCRGLLSVIPAFVKEGDASPLQSDLPTIPRIARLAGPIFSRAFRRFAPLIPGARSIYLSSLSALLEETAAGNADFALLPVEDAKGVRFLHFYEEFDRLDLHITHTCLIPSEENGRNIRFALLSKLYLPATALPCEPFLECRLSGEEPTALSDLLTAAAAAGLKLQRMDSLPDPYLEDQFTYYPVFAAGNASGNALLNAYMALYLPRAAVVGKYLHLKEEKNT